MAPEQVEGQAGRRTDGHLCLRRGALRDAHREAGVRGEEPGEPDRGHSRASARRRRPLARPLTPPAVDHVVGTASRKIPTTGGRARAIVVRELTWIAESGDAIARTLVQRRFSAPHADRDCSDWPRAWSIGVVAMALVRAPRGAFGAATSRALIRTFVSVAPADQLRGLPCRSTHLAKGGRVGPRWRSRPTGNLSCSVQSAGANSICICVR